MEKYTKEELSGVTWNYNDGEYVFVGIEGDSYTFRDRFVAHVDDIHPCYIREINLKEGWAVKMFPLHEDVTPFNGEISGLLQEFYKTISDSGILIEKDGDIKREKFKFKKAKLIIYDADMKEEIATFEVKK